MNWSKSLSSKLTTVGKTLLILLTAGTIAVLVGCFGEDKIQDTPKKQGKTKADFPQTASKHFDAMDGGIELTDDERKGRNTWLLWTAGNEAFWNHLSQDSFGSVDLLKLLDTRKRDSRLYYLGLVNDPDFKKSTKPDKYGLWMDKEVIPQSEDISEQVYGRGSGIIGLRLFPNPDFDDKAAKHWDARKYYTDRDYYYDKKLVRPYRVGMTCAICHVAPHPIYPPADPEKPKWENLSSNIGNQYFWVNRVFGFDLGEDNFVHQLLGTNPPGTLDTSFIATDNINNPRTMNAIFNVGARLAAGEMEKQNDSTMTFHGQKKAMKVPHVLKDGADSIGVLGALARVFVNIGEFHEQWITNHNPMVGGKKQTPFTIKYAQENSVYWQATEERVDNLAAFFVKSAVPVYLKDAPGGSAYLTEDEEQLRQGKLVYAEQCAECHSSKQPPDNIAKGTDAYKQWFRDAVQQPDFLDNNYLSDEKRYPVTELGTNACAALASNGVKGHVWDNFTSDTYKALPHVGKIKVQHPLTGSTWEFDPPAGGRGYYRTPSLIGLWTSGPYLHNNSVGSFSGNPSVAARMRDYQNGIELMFWPERRRGMNSIYRTSAKSDLIVNKAFLPKLLQGLADENGELHIGPIPKGTPIGLLSNLKLTLDQSLGGKIDLVKVIAKIAKALKRIKKENMNDEQSTELLKTLVPDMLKVNGCPDFVTDRGHLYGSDLSDEDKYALIEYLKTL